MAHADRVADLEARLRRALGAQADAEAKRDIAIEEFAALAKREAVAVPDGYVMVEIGYLPDRCIAAARRDAAIVAKVAPNDDCAILSAAINAYLLAASPAAKPEGAT